MMHISVDEALESPRRRGILATVQVNPGISFRALARQTGLAPGSLRHHLNVLRRTKFTVERQHGATVRFFPAAHDGDWVEAVLRREPALAVLHDWLKLHPRSSQGKVLLAMSAQRWPRSTTQHRLARLVDGGLATLRFQGRYKLYSASMPSSPNSSDSSRQAGQQDRTRRREEAPVYLCSAPVLQVLPTVLDGGPSQETTAQANWMDASD